jgi:integrase
VAVARPAPAQARRLPPAWLLEQPLAERGAIGHNSGDVSPLALVLPDAEGNIEDPTALYRMFGALQMACDLTQPALDTEGKPVLDEDGKPEVRQRYGLHAMRHACASPLIRDGWSPKRIQVFLGHSTIRIVFDTNGHLFADAEADQRAMAKLESALLK